MSGRRKSSKASRHEELLKEQEAERLRIKKEQEEERERKWIEAWEKKLEQEDYIENCKACCAPGKFFPKPKIQSNIWIQVNHEKNSQQVQMAFKNVPIPKPKPPPLPKLKEPVEIEEKANDTSSIKTTESKKKNK